MTDVIGEMLNDTSKDMRYKRIFIYDIDPCEYNMYPMQEIEQLAQNISECGLIRPQRECEPRNLTKRAEIADCERSVAGLPTNERGRVHTYRNTQKRVDRNGYRIQCTFRSGLSQSIGGASK